MTARRGNPLPLTIFIIAHSTKGERIATPVCALVRNDMVILGEALIHIRKVGQVYTLPGFDLA